VEDWRHITSSRECREETSGSKHRLGVYTRAEARPSSWPSWLVTAAVTAAGTLVTEAVTDRRNSIMIVPLSWNPGSLPFIRRRRAVRRLDSYRFEHGMALCTVADRKPS
jgi:hypothetical protein